MGKNMDIDELLNLPYWLIEDCGLDVLVGDALIQYSSDDTHMTVYNPSEQLLTLIKTLAQAEGLFVWKPEDM